ncbi:MAG: Type 1 glutamine amidotransferase-like domain-containing protein, partial [Actinomycetota bacterium]|nr:Type 1 glutamine amidotransferase-like domain-containing protein [Actinomycetota bacterium]
WERGIVLCGLSAGSLCWFDEGLTGYQDESKRVLGLGFLPYSNMVHFKAGSEQHEVYERELKEGLRPGYAAADGAALHFVDTELAQVIASRSEARAYRLDLRGERPKTTQIATRFLGSPDHIPLIADSVLPWSSLPLNA